MPQRWAGLAAIVGAGAIWGLSPIYWRLLSDVPSLEVLAHRTVWSLVAFALLIWARGHLRRLVAVIRDRAIMGRLCLGSVLIALNWFGFILAVQIDRTSESSLGYYLFPLLAVAAGWALHGERFARLQQLAFLLAVTAVLLMVLRAPQLPWLALLVAVSFTMFGLVKRGVSVSPMISVTVEMLVLLVPALVWLGGAHLAGWAAGSDAPGVFGTDARLSVLLMLSVFFTAVPLLLFSYGASRLRYSAVGVAQYLNPTLQFLCAVLIFGEPLSLVHLLAFALIWAGVAFYCVEALRQERRSRRVPITSLGV